MDKNWLIRTKSNHILGPISKEKVVELYKNGSIKPDDEVCSGNGYWFFIREDDMVERFLLGHETQSFNPISEAKDVITHPVAGNKSESHTDDLTLVGGLNLASLKEPATATVSAPPLPDNEASAPKHSETTKEPVPSETKKKNNLTSKQKNPVNRPAPAPLKKQSYLKYLGMIGFILLFLLIYYRKTIIQMLFQGEITRVFNLIDSAHAQDPVPEKKKRVLESYISHDKVTFKPSIGIDGFRVISQFEIEEVNCQELTNEVYQLAVILYPPEMINEKFIIKLRDCVLKMPETHPVKQWLKWMAASKPLNAKDQARYTFLTNIINSQFNLITDQKIKNEIINLLYEIPENTLSEKLLKSYLYLMIGNITRSDNILRDFMTASPRVNWEQTGLRPGLFHKAASSHIAQLFAKIGRHPADRRTFELFGLYIQSFYNDPALISLADDIDTSDVEEKVGLKFIESLAPSFVNYLRITYMEEGKRFSMMRDLDKLPLKEQSYWLWPFIEIDPLVSEVMIPELKRIESEDQIWFIYLLDNEKLADLFSSKSGKSFLPGRRPYLKKSLDDHHTFMMSLYKLIELGDIDSSLVQKTSQHLIHE